MDLVTVLQNAQNPNLEVRSQAEAHLNQAIEAQYGPFLLALTAELATEGKPDHVRQLAGLYIKNLITAKDNNILEQKVNKWVQCDPATKDQIRAGFLQSLQSPIAVVSHTAAQILAAYGAVDVVRNEWPTLLPALLHNVASPEIPVKPKVSSLEALGYMCDAMDPDEVSSGITAQMLSAIIDGMRNDRPNEIRLAGVVALYNSLDFVETNFENATERDVIMRTLCESTQCNDMKVREKAFECIARVADLYYDKLQTYVETLFQLSTTAMRTDDPSVGMQAIEFWTTVADNETNIQEDINDGVEPPPVYLKLIEQAAPLLVPILLESLTKQQEDASGDDDWNIAMAGATCLEAMAVAIGDNITGLVLPFVQQNISNANWRLKEASIMAFCTILEGPSPDKLNPIVAQAMPILVGCLKDPNQMVRESTAYTLGKVCENHKEAVSAEMLRPMIEGLTQALNDSYPKAAYYACYALHNLAGACAEERDEPTNVLSQFMQFLLEKLLACAGRPDGEEENIRSSAYEAINMIVSNSAQDMKPIVNQLLVEALNRLEATFAATFNPHERTNLQSSLCALVGECIMKLEIGDLAPHSDRIMQFLLQVFNTRGSYHAHEDAFLAIGYMTDKLESHLSRYMTHLQPAIISGLRNIEEYQLCTVCVGVVGDVCRALKKDAAPFCDDIMRCLLELLQSPVIHRSVKPYVISAFADIAMAIEGEFDRYTSIVLGILKQAGEVVVEDSSDEDLVEYINSLRQAILVAYTGIIQGLKEARKQDSVLPAVDTIRLLIGRSVADDSKSEDVIKAAVGLLGDLGQTFGTRVQALYRESFVQAVIMESMEIEDFQPTAKWAKDIVTKVAMGKNP